MNQLVVIGFCVGVSAGALQSPAPRDTPPPAIENARRERDLKALAAAGTATKETYLELAALLDRQNRLPEAIDAQRSAAALDPASPEAQHRAAVYVWDAVRRSEALDKATRRALLRTGMDLEDRAQSLRPDYLEAMTYKNILLRMDASLTSDETERARILADADALRSRVIALQAQRPQPEPPPGAPPPPPMPFPGYAEPFEQAVARLQPVRVGGNFRTPVKTKDVKPVYPADAQRSRAQGVVIIEAIIGEDGKIANARILRSIEALDAAALGAVSQWEFTPSTVDGRPVSVIMTVTVNFTLQ